MRTRRLRAILLSVCAQVVCAAHRHCVVFCSLWSLVWWPCASSWEMYTMLREKGPNRSNLHCPPQARSLHLQPHRPLSHPLVPSLCCGKAHTEVRSPSEVCSYKSTPLVLRSACCQASNMFVSSAPSCGISRQSLATQEHDGVKIAASFLQRPSGLQDCVAIWVPWARWQESQKVKTPSCMRGT